MGKPEGFFQSVRSGNTEKLSAQGRKGAETRQENDAAAERAKENETALAQHYREEKLKELAGYIAEIERGPIV